MFGKCNKELLEPMINFQANETLDKSTMFEVASGANPY
jgi:hypothetical protein